MGRTDGHVTAKRDSGSLRNRQLDLITGRAEGRCYLFARSVNRMDPPRILHRSPLMRRLASKKELWAWQRSDTLRYTKIPLTHGSGAIPALGFGTLIPDPVATKQRPRPHWKWDFVSSIVRNATAMKKRSAMRCRRCSRRGRFSGRTCSSPRSSGTTIIVLSASNPPSRRVASDSNSTMSIAISSIPPLPSNPATSRTRGTSAAR